MRKNKLLQGVKIPQHIAIIMDGNGRWAKKRMMPRSVGHKHGMQRMVGLMEHAFELGVQYITVYALSTENLKRPKEEIEGDSTYHYLTENNFDGDLIYIMEGETEQTATLLGALGCGRLTVPQTFQGVAVTKLADRAFYKGKYTSDRKSVV